MLNRVLSAIAVVAVGVGLLLMARSQTARASTSPPSAPPERPWLATVAAVGLVETSTENLSIGTPVSDVVTEVAVTAGRSVKAGDVLFRLDDRPWRADLEVRKAELRVAESQEKVEEARVADVAQNLAFVERVSDPRAVSEEEVARRRFAVVTARARLDEARARVVSAAAQVGVIETRIDRCVVKAPVDGDVLQVKIHPGEFATAGPTSTPLVLLGRLRPLHLRVDVDEHEAWRVKSGAKATASVRGNAGLKAPLTFVRFEPFVVPKRSLTGDATERVDTRVLQVIYRIDGESLNLFAGQQMDVFIEAAP